MPRHQRSDPQPVDIAAAAARWEQLGNGQRSQIIEKLSDLEKAALKLAIKRAKQNAR